MIENNVLSDNTLSGIAVTAKAVTIRNNAVYNTGGSTLNPDPLCGNSIGISTVADCDTFIGYAYTVEIVNNTVINTFGLANGTPTGLAIFGSADPNGGSLAWGNRVIGVTGTAGQGIRSFDAHDVCRDNSVVNSASAAYQCASLVGINSSN